MEKQTILTKLEEKAVMVKKEGVEREFLAVPLIDIYTMFNVFNEPF